MQKFKERLNKPITFGWLYKCYAVLSILSVIAWIFTMWYTGLIKYLIPERFRKEPENIEEDES